MNLRKNKKAEQSVKQGFTLVELLLVMAIIGILAGVIFAMMAPARKNARVANFKQQVNTINSSAIMCIDGGGTIQQNVAPGGNICNNGNMSIPTAMKRCDTGVATTGSVITNVASANTDAYNMTLRCDDGAGCTAHCTMEGCSFDADCIY